MSILCRHGPFLHRRTAHAQQHHGQQHRERRQHQQQYGLLQAQVLHQAGADVVVTGRDAQRVSDHRHPGEEQHRRAVFPYRGQSLQRLSLRDQAPDEPGRHARGNRADCP